MIRSRTFEWNAHYAGSKPGWVPVNADEAWFPGDGFLTAHDTMEHLSNKTDWAHELRAAGVSLYVLKGMDSRTVGTIAEDIVQFAASGAHRFQAPRAPERWSKPLPAKHEKCILRFTQEMHSIIERGLPKAVAKGMPPEYVADAHVFAALAEPWVRLGYRAAMRVYGEDNGYEVGRTIERLRDAVNTDHDKLMPLEGEKLVVSVDTDALTFTVNRLDTKSLSPNERAKASFVESFTNLLAGVR